MIPAVWTIVLAAGSGRRLADVTGGVPKQFWRYNGTDTLLGETLQRVAPISTPTRTLIVVDRRHDGLLKQVADLPRFGRILSQPGDRGTAPGVLLPLIHVLEREPDAVVLITPSDHGVDRSAEFSRGVRDGVAAVQAGTHEVVLFGVEPDGPSSDFGWITPTLPVSRRSRFSGVARFVEKPARDEAERLFRGGSVWNTMVLVARASTLFALCREHIPELTRTFARALRMPASARLRFLADQYHELPSADFSHDVLTPARGLALATFPASMGWTDLGTPDRLARWRGRGTFLGLRALETTQGAA